MCLSVCVCYTKQKVAVVTLVDQSGAIDGPEMRKMRNVCETRCDVGLPLLVEGGNVSVPLVSCRFYSIVVQWGGEGTRPLEPVTFILKSWLPFLLKCRVMGPDQCADASPS